MQFPPNRPITYCIHYGGRNGHLAEPSKVLSQIAQAPPTLMHIAHDVPFPNTYGPFVAEDASVRLLSAYEVAERNNAIRDLLAGFRRAGCTWVIPYICNQTLFGDIDKRLGIWMFYDRWDDYADFGIGPRPGADPLEWMAREPDGRLHYNYELRHDGAMQIGLLRYAPCCNNPYYNEWQRLVVSQLAEIGYDGVFVDNCNLNCYCAFCQNKFREYLAQRFPAGKLPELFGFDGAQNVRLGEAGSRLLWVKRDPLFKQFLRELLDDATLTRWFGTADLDRAALEEAGNGWLWGRARDYRRWLETRFSPERIREMLGDSFAEWGIASPQDRLLWYETKRFWADSVRKNLEFIREVGRTVRPDFFVTPNWGNMEEPDAAEFREEIGHWAAVWAPGMDFMMFEEGNAAGGVAPGLYLDHIVQHKYCESLGIRGAVLPYGHMHDGAVDLGNAQNAAHQGFGYIQPGVALPEARRKWSEFLEQHADKFAEADPVADIGLVLLFSELVYENHRHIEWVQRLARYLADQHVLFRVITERQLEAGPALNCRAVILPEVRFLDDDQVRVLIEFHSQGGALVLVGENATHDAYARSRSSPGFEEIRRKATRRSNGLRISRNGRTVVAESPEPLIGRHTLSREQTLQFATYAQASLNVPSGSAGIVYQLDRMLGVDRYYDPVELVPRLEAALKTKLRIADPYEAAGVRFSMYRQGDGRYLLHVVNYNVATRPHPTGKQVEPVQDLMLALPASVGGGRYRATAFEPGAFPEYLAVESVEGRLRVQLPQLGVYKLILLEAE